MADYYGYLLTEPKTCGARGGEKIQKHLGAAQSTDSISSPNLFLYGQARSEFLKGYTILSSWYAK